MNRGGKRQGAGRKDENNIQKTFHIKKAYFESIIKNEGKSLSDKLNNILADYYKKT
jgi:hypothetical protein